MYVVTVADRTHRAATLGDATAIVADELTSLLATDYGLADDVGRVNAAVGSGAVSASLTECGAWETTLQGRSGTVTVRVSMAP